MTPRATILLLAAILPAACSQAPDRVIDDAARARIDSTLAAFVETGTVAGASAVVWEKGREAYFGAFGMADRAAGTPMSRETIVQIYSMTKPLTGTALMTLFEDGLFELDDPLADYLPEFADPLVFEGLDEAGNPILVPARRPITVRDITRHTAGFAGSSSPEWLLEQTREAAPMNSSNTLAEMSRRLATVPLDYHPGDEWLYGISVDVQARLVEVLSGRPFGEYLQAEVLDPLGMSETRYVVPAADTARMSAAYRVQGSEPPSQVPDAQAHAFNLDAQALTPGGWGLTSTLDDYLRFTRMMLGGGELDGTRILEPETVALMSRNHLPDGQTDRMWLPSKGQVGFGVDFAVRLLPPLSTSENHGKVGEFYWDGAAMTLFWIDPANDLTTVFFVQVFPWNASIHKDYRDAVYGRITAEQAGHSALESLRWLEGRWDRVDVRPGRSAFEEWTRQPDGSLSGLGVTLVGTDTAFVERLRLHRTDGSLTYTADTPGNPAPVDFAVTEIAYHGFTVENLVHDFPKRIEYQLVGDTLRAVISGDGNLAAFVFARSAAGALTWDAYGAEPGGSRFLPSKELSPARVGDLEIAWTYRTGEAAPAFATEKPASFQATPLYVDGALLVSTPLGRVASLDPETGEERWLFDPEIRRDIPYGDFAARGVATWLDPSAGHGAPCRRSIFVGTAQSQLIALDALTGQPCPRFGERGSVDLLQGLRIRPFEPQAYSLTSPPAAARGLVVIGSSIADNSRPNPASGEVRAFDARTGALVWSWDPIPQRAEDPAFGDWHGELAHATGGANVWSVPVVDEERDLVFVPTSSPAPDYYGGLRLGQNRYGNSLVALRLSTGEVVWSFQTVHHDLWDYDNASPPALTTIRRDGEEIPVVLQATKTGMLFVLHRETGIPVLEVEERPVPESRIPGEAAWPTQPFTAVTPPLSPHTFSLDEDLWAPTEEGLAACRQAIAPLRWDGVFTPPDTAGTLVLPSNIGGAHWGGVAVDPGRQIAVVPVNRLAAMVQLIPRGAYDREAYRRQDEALGHNYEYNMMIGTPYVMRRRFLWGPSGLPCTRPPWGSLVAVDLVTGQHRWNSPLGSVSALTPDGSARPEWGSPNLGGPIATAGGLVFIGAALDAKLHAYDIESGREVWTGDLPNSARATPMAFRTPNGTHFVLVAVGGGDVFGSGDHLVAFRLPAE